MNTTIYGVHAARLYIAICAIDMATVQAQRDLVDADLAICTPDYTPRERDTNNLVSEVEQARRAAVENITGITDPVRQRAIIKTALESTDEEFAETVILRELQAVWAETDTDPSYGPAMDQFARVLGDDMHGAALQELLEKNYAEEIDMDDVTKAFVLAVRYEYRDGTGRETDSVTDDHAIAKFMRDGLGVTATVKRLIDTGEKMLEEQGLPDERE